MPVTAGGRHHRRLIDRVNRVAVLIRRRVPAVLIAVGVVAGEAGAWLLPEGFLMGAIALAGVGCCVAPRALRVVVVTFLLGMSVGAIVIQGALPPTGAEDATLLLHLHESPRHPRTGEVVFTGRDRMEDRVGMVRCRARELPWREVSQLQQGDLVWVRARLTPVVREANPFSWDSSLWRRGVGSECEAQFISQPVARFPDAGALFREWLRDYTFSVGGERRGVALFLSLAFGLRDVLSEYVERAFSALGMTHLLVVSGFQVSMVFVWCSWGGAAIGRCVGVPRPRFWGTLVALLGAGGYVYAIGGDISVVRAFVAVVLVCLSYTRERSRSFFQRWAVALVLVEVMWPFSFFDAGVELTFAALAGIGVGRYMGGRRRLSEWLWVAVCVWLFTTTVLLPRTGQISLAALLVNPLLAGGASLLNCVVGILALVAQIAGIDRYGYLLATVAWVNERIAELVVALGAAPGIGCEIENPIIRGVLACILLSCSIMVTHAGIVKTRWGALYR